MQIHIFEREKFDTDFLYSVKGHLCKIYSTVSHDLEKSKFSLLYERSEAINLEQMLLLYFVLT